MNRVPQHFFHFLQKPFSKSYRFLYLLVILDLLKINSEICLHAETQSLALDDPTMLMMCTT